MLKRHKSTISREVRRNRGLRGYRPEQVSGWLSIKQGLHVSHEWIYQYVYADKRRGR